MTWLMVGLLVLLGVLMMLVPNISRVTVRLGVDVPRDRIDDPVVTRAVLRYRILGSALTLAVIAGAVVTRGNPAVQALWVLILVAGWLIVYALCRRPIIASKAQQQWYHDKQVRIGASVASQVGRRRPVMVLHLAAVAFAFAVLIVLVVNYSALPDPYPMHWGADGQVDRWAVRSWGTVLMAPLLALALACFIWLLAWFISRRRDPQLPDGAAASAQRLGGQTDEVIQVLLGVTNVLCTLVLVIITVLPLTKASQSTTVTSLLAVTVLTLVPSVWAVVAVSRAQHRERERGTTGPESPDDDRSWKLGLFYYNTADPSFMVPKRSGFGYTVNMGHPWGMAFMVATLVIVVFTVLMSLVAR